jgi:hypothetical protein
MDIRMIGAVAVLALVAGCGEIVKPAAEAVEASTGAAPEVVQPVAVPPTEVAAVAIEGCTVPSCHAMGDLAAFELLQVGQKEGGSVASNGQEGYLVFGPYMAFEPGTYRLVLNGSVEDAAGAKVDVTAATGQKVFTDVALPRQTGNLVDTLVTIPEAVSDLEVRVFVTAASKVRIDSLTLRPQG